MPNQNRVKICISEPKDPQKDSLPPDHTKAKDMLAGGMAERLNAPVLKTGKG